MPKKFLITLPANRYSDFHNLLDGLVFPVMSRKETLPENFVRITVMTRFPKTEKVLETKIFGPEGIMTKNGFEAEVSEKDTCVYFRVRVPRETFRSFIHAWSATAPGSGRDVWSCVHAEYSKENDSSYLFEVQVTNVFAADAIEVLFTGDTLGNFIHSYEVEHKEVHAA